MKPFLGYIALILAMALLSAAFNVALAIGDSEAWDSWMFRYIMSSWSVFFFANLVHGAAATFLVIFFEIFLKNSESLEPTQVCPSLDNRA